MKMINYKKRSFYTRLNNNTFGECAVKVSGYWFYQTDVKVDEIRWLIPLYTYKHGSVWYVVEGGTGLSVGPTFTTRKAAVEYVMRDEILDKLRNAVNECVNDCNFTMIDEFPEEKTFDSFESMKRAEEDIQRQCQEEAEEAPEAEPEPDPESEPETAEPAEPEEVVETAEPAEHNEPQDVSYYRFSMDFSTCQTLEALKSMYLNEYETHKSDREVIAELTRAWGKHFDSVKCLHVNKTGKIYSTENRDKHEAVSDFPMLVELVSGLEDISISIEGTWTWITGNTKPHKEALKSLGFRWSPKRRAWCKLPAEKCA